MGLPLATRWGSLQLHIPPSAEPWLAPARGLLGRPRAAFVPAAAVPCEGLGLWWPCPEPCRGLRWVLPWGQPSLGCWAGLGWERAGRWGEVGRGWAGLGSAQQRATAASGSGGSMQGRAPSRAWCCRARAGEGSPELQGQGRGGRSGPLLAWAEQEGGPGHSSPHRSLPGPARRSQRVQGQALHCGHRPCLPSSCHGTCGGCSREDPQPAPAWDSAKHIALALSSALLDAL